MLAIRAGARVLAARKHPRGVFAEASGAGLERCSGETGVVYSESGRLRLNRVDRSDRIMAWSLVFGKCRHIAFENDGHPMRRIVRNTLVFLNTSSGWKIVHEHNTPKSCFEQGAED